MRRNEFEKLAEYTAKLTAAKVMEQLNELFGKLQVPEEEKDEYVDAKEAAKILGLTPNYLCSKKEMFPHVKVGANSQGRILFKRSELMTHYINAGR